MSGQGGESRFYYGPATTGLAPSGVSYRPPVYGGNGSMDMNTIGGGTSLNPGAIAFSSDSGDRPTVTAQVVPYSWSSKQNYHQNYFEGDVMFAFDRNLQGNLKNAEYRPVMLSQVQMARHWKQEGEASRNFLKMIVDKTLREHGMGIMQSDFDPVWNDGDDGDDGTAGAGADADELGLVDRRRIEGAKNRQRRKMKRFLQLLQDGNTGLGGRPILNLEELDNYIALRNPATSEAMRQDYINYAKTMSRWETDHQKRVERLVEAERNEHAGVTVSAEDMSADASVGQKTYSEIVKNVTEEYAMLLDHSTLHPNDRDFSLLYSLANYYEDDLIYLSPELLVEHWNFMGICGTVWNKEDTGFMQLSRSGSSYNVTDVPRLMLYTYGKARMKNIIHPDLRQGHLINTVLVRRWDEEEQCYSHVVPLFTFGFTNNEGHYAVDSYEERYVDHRTGKQVHLTRLPVMTPYSYYIGCMDKQESHGMRPSLQTYEVAQGVYYDKKPIEDSYKARKELPDMTIYVRSN
jgi:hypothetical protein